MLAKQWLHRTFIILLIGVVSSQWGKDIISLIIEFDFFFKE